jgi:hypothetical protein
MSTNRYLLRDIGYLSPKKKEKKAACYFFLLNSNQSFAVFTHRQSVIIEVNSEGEYSEQEKGFYLFEIAK